MSAAALPGVRTRAACAAGRCRGPRGRAGRPPRRGLPRRPARATPSQLRPAVAAQRAEDVAGQAFGVHPDQYVVAVAEVAGDQRDVFDAVLGVAVAVGGEVAVGGGQPGLGLAAHGRLALPAVGDQVLDGDDRQAVLAGEQHQFRQPRHGAVLVGDLADGRGRAQAGEPGEVDARLGVAVAGQHAAGAGPQREDVAGAHEVARGAAGVAEHAQGQGAVGGADAGGGAVFGGGVHADGEGGTHRLGVLGHHLRQVEAVQLGAFQRGADQAAALGHHEGDQFGGGELGGEDQVALVLPVLVVDHHDRAAGRDVRDGPLHGVQGQALVRRALGSVPVRQRGHAAAPSRTGPLRTRVRSHQARRPAMTRTK